MPKDMVVRAKALAMARGFAESQFQVYLEGCMMGLKLKGDWSVDTTTWSFTEMPKEEK